jgi:hypothetical protein
MKNLFILFVLIVTCAFGQNTQVVFDFDALNRPVAKVMPFELVKSGDTTLILGAQYGLENNQERFRFSFTVQAENQMFYKTSEHTFLLIIGENCQGKVASLEELTYQANSLTYDFVFTAGDLGYEDNDISLQRMGAIKQIIIHQLPEMDMIFTLKEEQQSFLKDLQSSLRIAYRRGDNPGASAVRGGFGNEKSSRSTRGRR